jgi:hypothetical protein
MRPFRQSGSHHFQMPTAGPPISHPEQGTLERATYSPVRFDAGPRGPPRPLSLSSAYKSDGRWKISPPPSLFLPPCRGEHYHHSSPASRRATRPFDDSFGGVAPHTLVLLLPHVSRSSGRSSDLHRASCGQPSPTLVSSCSCASCRQ